MLTIGSIQLDVPVVQAAMSGYTDRAMRRLARQHGAPYAIAEAVLDRLVMQRGRKRTQILGVMEHDHPVGAQLLSADPDDIGPAAATMVEAGYDVIDVNFGCPVRKVLGRRRGGFLLSEPGTALAIVRSVCAAVGSTHPVTVKMRRGTDDTSEAERNFFLILDGVFDLGVSAVTVHARTVQQRYVGPSDWQFLARVKEHVKDRTILGSGDLFTAEACLRMLRETGVDGVTIARGCVGNPWIFDECRALWRGEERPPPPSIDRQREAIAGHWAGLVELHGEVRAAKIMRKFGIRYARRHPLFKPVRDAFIATRTPSDIQELLLTWYDPNGDWPPMPRTAGPEDLIAAGACP